MARVLGVGVGIFVMSFIWVLCLFICIILSRADSGIAKVGPLAIITALLLTIILVVIPRESQLPTLDEEIKKYDFSIIYRSSLLAACSLFVVIGLFFYLTYVINEPVHARPIRRRTR